MILLFPFALGQLLDGKFYIAAQLFRKPHEFKFLGLFCSVADILLKRYLRGIDSRLRTAQTDPDFLVSPGRVVRHIDGEYLRALLVGQAEQRLYLIELVDIFPLVKENLAVAVVDDGAFDDGRRDDVLDLLRDHHSLAEELSDGLK